jgi:hypothetical protein
VETAARDELSADRTAAPSGTTLDPESPEIKIGEAVVDGDTIRVTVEITAQAIPTLDVDAIRQQLGGLTPVEAEATLAGIGDVSVDLWPGWVTRVPTNASRVQVDVEGAAPPSPRASESP